jgi:hypothetical protein
MMAATILVGRNLMGTPDEETLHEIAGLAWRLQKAVDRYWWNEVERRQADYVIRQQLATPPAP